MKRTVCSDCGFLHVRCLCPTLSSIENKTKIIILQHPSEVRHALNTVAILKKSLMNIEVLIGEEFEGHPRLKELLAIKTALIFPNKKSTTLDETQEVWPQLLLIDGTWSKAKKIYFKNPTLQTLPHFHLNVTEKSRYTLRSSTLEHSLSTLEATILSLRHTEGGTKTDSLMDSFERMIQLQIQKMGTEVFEKNYKKKGR